MRRRVQEVSWILDYRRDVEADFRVFYRLAPWEAVNLPAPEYLALAVRLPAYPGVMAARLATLRQEEERGTKPGVTVIPGERKAVEAAGFGDLFD